MNGFENLCGRGSYSGTRFGGLGLHDRLTGLEKVLTADECGSDVAGEIGPYLMTIRAIVKPRTHTGRRRTISKAVATPVERTCGVGGDRRQDEPDHHPGADVHQQTEVQR